MDRCPYARRLQNLAKACHLSPGAPGRTHTEDRQRAAVWRYGNGSKEPEITDLADRRLIAAAPSWPWSIFFGVPHPWSVTSFLFGRRTICHRGFSYGRHMAHIFAIEGVENGNSYGSVKWLKKDSLISEVIVLKGENRLSLPLS